MSRLDNKQSLTESNINLYFSDNAEHFSSWRKTLSELKTKVEETILKLLELENMSPELSTQITEHLLQNTLNASDVTLHSNYALGKGHVLELLSSEINALTKNDQSLARAVCRSAVEIGLNSWQPNLENEVFLAHASDVGF